MLSYEYVHALEIVQGHNVLRISFCNAQAGAVG